MATPKMTETCRMALETHEKMIKKMEQNPVKFRSKNDFIEQAILALCTSLEPEPEPEPEPPKKRTRKKKTE